MSQAAEEFLKLRKILKGAEDGRGIQNEAKGKVTEWSKVLRSGRSLARGASSNLALVIITFPLFFSLRPLRLYF